MWCTLCWSICILVIVIYIDLSLLGKDKETKNTSIFVFLYILKKVNYWTSKIRGKCSKEGDLGIHELTTRNCKSYSPWHRKRLLSEECVMAELRKKLLTVCGHRSLNLLKFFHWTCVGAVGNKPSLRLFLTLVLQVSHNGKTVLKLFFGFWFIVEFIYPQYTQRSVQLTHFAL